MLARSMKEDHAMLCRIGGLGVGTHVRQFVIGDTLDLCLVGERPDSLLHHSDGGRQGCVDARVGCEFGREGRTAGGAVALALRRPACKAGQAEVVLAGGLWNRTTHEGRSSQL